MLASSFGCVLFSGLVSAAALPSSVPRSTSSSNLTSLSENDIIVWGKNGRVEVWPKTQYDYLVSLKSSAFTLTAATPLDASRSPSINTSPRNLTLDSRSQPKSNKLSTRSCKSATVIAENADQSFLNWDVPMTSVIHATGLTNVIQISSGYSIANSIGVSAAVKVTIEDFLETTYTISYTETWTTTTTSAYSFYAPQGQYAAIVSNPLTLRKTGTVYEGCIGDAEATTYQANSYSSQSWGNLAWVSGTISLCTGTTYPLPACTGSELLY